MKNLKLLLLCGIIISVFGSVILAQQEGFKRDNIKIQNVKSEYKKSEELRLKLINTDKNPVYFQKINGLIDFEIFVYDEINKQWLTVEKKQKLTHRTISFEKIEPDEHFIFEINMKALWATTNVERKINGNKYKVVINYYSEIPKDWTKDVKLYSIESKVFKLV